MLFYFTAVKGQTEAIVIVPHGTPKLQMVVEPGAKKAFCVWKKRNGPQPLANGYSTYIVGWFICHKDAKR